MRKRLLYAFVAIIILTIGLTNEYLKITYHANIIEYFNKSSQLTKEEIAWLEKHGSIVFGSDQSSPPLRYIDSQTGQYKGLIIDYIRALSIDLKHEIVFEPVEKWGDAFESLTGRQKDFFDMIVSEKRGEEFIFSDPIYTLQGVILKAKGMDVEIYSDLQDLAVAIPSGDYAIEFLTLRMPDLHIVETGNMEEAMTLLRENLVDVVVGDEPVIVYLMKELTMQEDFETTRPLYKEDTALAVRKSDEVLIRILNKGIINLKRKNVMADLQQKWFGITDNFSNKNSSDMASLAFLAFVSTLGVMIYIAYAWNVTLKNEVKKQTEELYASRQKLKVTLDGLTNPMVVINDASVVMNNNKIFCEFANCKYKQGLGQPVRDTHPIFEEEEISHLIEKTFETVSKQRAELSYNNSVYIVSAFPITDRINDRSIIVMLEDVTRIKVAEQRLLQDNKMKSLGVLAAGVAHEIRNPLGLIGHYSYILKTNKNNEIGRQEKAIEVIENSVERASNIIDNLLNFSRMTSEDARYRNMYEFISNITSLENKLLGSKNIKLALNCDEDLVCGVKPEPLKHILINLIDNSIDAVAENGEIEITCYTKGQSLVMTVADNGEGIAEEVIGDIFMPFYTSKPSKKGTGLGLYIVYNEVSKYGGTILVDSKVNEGTTFSLELPIQEVMGHGEI